METTMAKWTAFPHAGEFAYDAASVKKNWKRLHAGDAEPLPPMMTTRRALVEAARGDRPLDLVIRGGRLVNVFTDEIQPV